MQKISSILYKVVLYLWQLPQNVLGLLVIMFSGAKEDGGIYGVYFTQRQFGVSLGSYIIVNIFTTNKTIRHERGHSIQSLYLGWLYLLIIGLPSATFNIWDRLMHTGWNVRDRVKWYYSLPWEAWADKLGGVVR